MPINLKNYPKDWKMISLFVRTIVANNRCEFCGILNHITKENGSVVVLTVAHLNHNPMDCDWDNLKALCQKCHLNHDKDLHTQNRRKTKALKQGLMQLF